MTQLGGEKVKKSAYGVIRVWKSYGRSGKKTLLKLYPKYPEVQYMDDFSDAEVNELLNSAVEFNFEDEDSY